MEVREGEGAALKWARLEPYHGYKLSFEIEFNHPAVDDTGQQVVFDFGSGPVQARHRARPHLRLHQGRGDDARARPGAGRQHGQRHRRRRYRVLNAEGLRYDDEFAKHKILDAIGDLYMLGQPMLAALQSPTRAAMR